jgi:hypothetical protein
MSVPFVGLENSVEAAARDACAAILPKYNTIGLAVMAESSQDAACEPSTAADNEVILHKLAASGKVGDPVRIHAHVFAQPVYTRGRKHACDGVLGFHPATSSWFFAAVNKHVVAGPCLRTMLRTAGLMD